MSAPGSVFVASVHFLSTAAYASRAPTLLSQPRPEVPSGSSFPSSNEIRMPLRGPTLRIIPMSISDWDSSSSRYCDFPVSFFTL